MEKLLHNQYSPRVQMTMRRAKIGKKSGGDQPAGESAAMETTPIGHTQRATQRPVRNGRHWVKAAPPPFSWRQLP